LLTGPAPIPNTTSSGPTNEAKKTKKKRRKRSQTAGRKAQAKETLTGWGGLLKRLRTKVGRGACNPLKGERGRNGGHHKTTVAKRGGGWHTK